jgi:hypothetical protein
LGTISGARDYEFVNAGSVPLRIVVQRDSAGDFRVRSETCTGAELPPGARCVLSVEFAPSSARKHAAVLRLLDGGGNTIQRIVLSALGEAPRPHSAPPSLLPHAAPNE